jgi:hypothetical protein
LAGGLADFLAAGRGRAGGGFGGGSLVGLAGIGGSTRPLPFDPLELPEPSVPEVPLLPGAGRFGGRGSATVSSRPVSLGRSAMVTVTPPVLD